VAETPNFRLFVPKLGISKKGLTREDLGENHGKSAGIHKKQFGDVNCRTTGFFTVDGGFVFTIPEKTCHRRLAGQSRRLLLAPAGRGFLRGKLSVG